MPELSRFGGMVICLLFCDTKQYNNPHVHVYYGEYEAAIAIDGELLAGSLPHKQFRIVTGRPLHLSRMKIYSIIRWSFME